MDVEQQEAAEVVNKPVAEEQALLSQVLQGHLSNPDYDRAELRALRRFLRQPLVCASVQTLRKALQAYSATGELGPLVGAVREIYEQQGEVAIDDERGFHPNDRIRREDLRLVCYEYVYY